LYKKRALRKGVKPRALISVIGRKELKPITPSVTT